MGTVMAPALRIAKSPIDHSGRFSEIKATRSCEEIPASANPSAMWRTRPINSSAEIRTHLPSRLSLTVSDLLWRATASRQTAGKVIGALKFCWSGKKLTAAAEDTENDLLTISAALWIQLPVKGKLETDY